MVSDPELRSCKSDASDRKPMSSGQIAMDTPACVWGVGVWGWVPGWVPGWDDGGGRCRAKLLWFGHVMRWLAGDHLGFPSRRLVILTYMFAIHGPRHTAPRVTLSQPPATVNPDPPASFSQF